MRPEKHGPALVMVNSLVIADICLPNVSRPNQHSGCQLQQLAATCPAKALQFDQIANQWPNQLLNRFDTIVVYSRSRSVVACLSAALQQWRDGLQCLKR